MPLAPLQLDDRRFADLVSFLRDRIPGFSKEWTDFNPSDPGITLMELWCWLAEMILYRTNQVSQRTFTNFFKLILDPPEAVTAEVTLEFLPQLSGTPITIPPGIQFEALTLSPPESLIFETFTSTVLEVTLTSPPELVPPALFPVRSRVVVEDEELGVSDGEPEQIVYLKQGPVLTDDNNTGVGPGIYNPNPRITVDGDTWQYVPDFLESTTGPNSKQFMVEKLTGGIRFGDGVTGSIPPAGARLVAERYQIVQGKEVRIGADTLALLDPIPGLPASDITSISNKAAEGGYYIYPPGAPLSSGLPSFRKEFRMITAKDFEDVATAQFNQAQESVPAPPQPAELVARVVVVPGKKLDGPGPFNEQPGVVSVIVLPEPARQTDVELQPSSSLVDKLSRFLDRRRLLTTRVFVVGPQYVPISFDVQLTAESHTNAEQLKGAIDTHMRQFFHPLTGGDQGNGWPLGRSVYKSELFQLIESVEGVDHVDAIVIGGNRSLASRALGENQLPLVKDITIAL